MPRKKAKSQLIICNQYQQNILPPPPPMRNIQLGVVIHQIRKSPSLSNSLSSSFYFLQQSPFSPIFFVKRCINYSDQIFLSLCVAQKRMLGNGVTPAAGAAEPLWQAELPNLARNINLNPKKLKCNQFTTRVEVCQHHSQMHCKWAIYMSPSTAHI